MNIPQIFNINISNDKMIAYLDLNRNKLSDLYTEYSIEEVKQSMSPSDIEKVLKNSKVVYGIKEEKIEEIIESIDHIDFPVVIAEGKRPKNGENGKVKYHVNLTITLSIEDKGKIDFKEIMKIPKVEVGDKLATIIPPTDGEKGINVRGEEVLPKPGKEVRLRAGENTKLIEEDKTIYATDSGQVSAQENKINVLPVFEVQDDLDLSIGNIDFNGSIVIRGDVPNGFSLKARGDIQVYGLVEAATLDAGGSILIKEGISGLGKGLVKAGLDIHVGNVNQGSLEAGRDVLIEKSVLHSQVVAREVVFCKTGSIVGGSISAGKKVLAKDIGNRMSTKTFIYLGENKKVLEERTRIMKEMKEVAEQIKKLEQIGLTLNNIKNQRQLTEKENKMLIRQKQSMKQVKQQLLELRELYDHYREDHSENADNDNLVLTVYGVIYPNVNVISGKYSYPFQTDYKHVNVTFSGKDFHINAL